MELPRTLKRIEYSAFEDCRNLKGILLPERLEFIGKRVFFNARLASVSIPKSVVEIASGAFYGARLRRVAFEPWSRLGRVGDSAFGGNELLN